MFKVWGSGLIAAGVVFFASAVFAQSNCATDYNGDGVTDDADVEIFNSALGARSGDDNFIAQADLDEDGEVTLLDYSILLSCN